MNSQNLFDLLLVVIGGLIGFSSSLCIIIVQRFLDKKGKLNIFYKFSNRKDKGVSWGFEKIPNNRMAFIIPVIFEFQNTSNITRVIRDVSLDLYNKDQFICKMVQVDYLQTEHKTNNKVDSYKEQFYGEKGSYSFVIGPRSIVYNRCIYMLHVSINELSYLCNLITLEVMTDGNKQL